MKRSDTFRGYRDPAFLTLKGDDRLRYFRRFLFCLADVQEALAALVHGGQPGAE